MTWVVAVAVLVVGLSTALPTHDPNDVGTLGNLEEEGSAMAGTETLLCARCGGPGDGWKCAICGSLAREHDTGHVHGGSDRYCTIRCAGCSEADVRCTCV